MLDDFLKFVSPAPRDNNDKSRPEEWAAKPPAFSAPRGYYGERLGQQVTWWILAISPWRRPELDTIKMIDDGRRRRLITARGKTSAKKVRLEIK